MRAFALLLMLIPLVALGEEPKPANPMCPIQKDRKAVAEHTVTYQGRKISFCCEDCVDIFNEDPDAFLARLPEVESTPPTTESPEASAPAERGGEPWSWVALLPYLHMALAALVAWQLLKLPVRVWRNRRAAEPRRWTRLVLGIGAGELVACLLVGVCGQLVWDGREMSREIAAHEAWQADQRRQRETAPIPPRPTVPNQLAATYYRGNDERHPELENGGSYRTATIRIALLDGSKQPLKVGAPVGDEPLWLKVEIARSPFTINLYHSAIMGGVYLTRDAASVVPRGRKGDNRIRLETREPEHRWDAIVPIPAGQRTGIVYLCRGKQIHYAIKHDLQIAAGKVTAASDVWMAHVYVPAGLSVPTSEWFDHRPIAELTRKPTVTEDHVTGQDEHPKKPK